MNLFTSLSPIRKKNQNNNRFNFSLFKDVIFEDQKTDYSNILLDSSIVKEEENCIKEENRSFDLFSEKIEKEEKKKDNFKKDKKRSSEQIRLEESFLSSNSNIINYNFSRKKKIKKNKKKEIIISPHSEKFEKMTKRYSENSEEDQFRSQIKLSRRRSFIIKTKKNLNDQTFLNKYGFIGKNQFLKKNKENCKKNFLKSSFQKYMMDLSLLENVEQKLFIETENVDLFLKNKKPKKSISVNLDNSQEDNFLFSLNKKN